MADAMDSKSIVRKVVWVRLPPPVSRFPRNCLRGIFFEITLVYSPLIVYIYGISERRELHNNLLSSNTRSYFFTVVTTQL